MRAKKVSSSSETRVDSASPVLVLSWCVKKQKSVSREWSLVWMVGFLKREVLTLPSPLLFLSVLTSTRCSCPWTSTCLRYLPQTIMSSSSSKLWQNVMPRSVFTIWPKWPTLQTKTRKSEESLPTWSCSKTNEFTCTFVLFCSMKWIFKFTIRLTFILQILLGLKFLSQQDFLNFKTNNI